MTMHALVIEDDQDAGELMVQMLRSFGFEVELVDHPHDALFVLSNRPPDLLVLDLCLPGMTGPAFLESARSMGASTDLAVVAVSAVYPKEDPISQAALAGGAAIFLGKPFTRDVMRIAARKALRRLLPDEIPKAPPPPPEPDDHPGQAPLSQGADSAEVEVLADDFDGQGIQPGPTTPDPMDDGPSTGDLDFVMEDDDDDETGPSPQERTPPEKSKAPPPSKDVAADTGSATLPPIQAFLADRNAVLVIERCSESELWVRCAGAVLTADESFRAEMSYTAPGQRRPIRFKMLLTVVSYDPTGAVPRAHLEMTEVKPLERWKRLVQEVESSA